MIFSILERRWACYCRCWVKDYNNWKASGDLVVFDSIWKILWTKRKQDLQWVGNFQCYFRKPLGVGLANERVFCIKMIWRRTKKNSIIIAVGNIHKICYVHVVFTAMFSINKLEKYINAEKMKNTLLIHFCSFRIVHPL